MVIEEKLQSIIPEWRIRITTLQKEHGDKKVDEVTIGQVLGGMRDVKGLWSDISSVDPEEGIRFRGFTIPEVLSKLPKLPDMEMPLVGGLYYLLLTGEIPELVDAVGIEDEWKNRSKVPLYVQQALRNLSDQTPSMTMFSIAILSLQGESQFTKHYSTGIRKEDHWRYMLDDSLNLTAKLPEIAAIVYHLKNKRNNFRKNDPSMDWSGNFAHLLGIDEKEYQELSRLFFILYSDHELGNVSAHATHLVGSTLADIYLGSSAGMNGLAGPLHGRAIQEGLHWLFGISKKYGRLPSENELRDYAWDTLNAGQVIPGYGHAILRKTDPRFTTFLDFGNNHFKNDEIFDLARMVYKVVPQVLKEQGKAKNIWPNVDAISGTVQHHYGIQDCDPNGFCGFYTVLFGISRILGVSAQAIWARALNQPLERAKSLTTASLEMIAHQTN